ncbi:hypothetical protein NONI108955_20090 [Nocardia ninae]|uniref:Uncharacterized protein n=1 Tax=Nocardia ninae NBRC 108245 TaxID=1210091 RepID=A0A511MAE5_9NOCA|nr:hypothetical protein NN4_12350 [Nocardia ninae NBRC 108245]
MSRIPTHEQWLHAITDRQAHLLCFAAIGYARGYCNAACIDPADAIDFGHAYAVLVASQRSRPTIEGAWRNWLADLDISTLSTSVQRRSPNLLERRESDSAQT